MENQIKKIITKYIDDDENVYVDIQSDKLKNINLSLVEKSQTKPITYTNYLLQLRGKSIVNGESYISLVSGKLSSKAPSLKYKKSPNMLEYRNEPKILKKKFSNLQELVSYLKSVVGDELYGTFIVKLMFKFPNLQIQELL